MKKILITEDRKIVREILKGLLEFDFQILEAENGLEAFNILSKENIDLLITDLGMDICTGYQLIEKIRNTKSKLKILAMSTEQAFLDLAKQYGADETICKTDINYDTFLNFIKKITQDKNLEK
jgi:CheY-like chemotaxis protein